MIFEINQQVNANVKFPGLRKTSGRTAEERSKDRPTGGSTLSIPRAATKKLKSSIALYMPATVGVSSASQYGEVEMGGMAMIGANVAKNIDREGFMKGFFKMKNVEDAGGVLGESFEMYTKKAVDVFAPGASAAYDIFRGKVTNNRLEMVFQGIGRRSFSFSFKIIREKNAANNGPVAIQNKINATDELTIPSVKNTEPDA